MQERFGIGCVAVSLKVLESNRAFGIAETDGWFLENRERVLEKIAFNGRSDETVEHACELVEQVVVHGIEDCRDMFGITGNARIRDTLLVVVRSAKSKPCPFKNSRIQDSHDQSPNLSFTLVFQFQDLGFSRRNPYQRKHRFPDRNRPCSCE